MAAMPFNCHQKTTHISKANSIFNSFYTKTKSFPISMAFQRTHSNNRTCQKKFINNTIMTEGSMKQIWAAKILSLMTLASTTMEEQAISKEGEEVKGPGEMPRMVHTLKTDCKRREVILSKGQSTSRTWTLWTSSPTSFFIGTVIRQQSVTPTVIPLTLLTWEPLMGAMPKTLIIHTSPPLIKVKARLTHSYTNRERVTTIIKITNRYLALTRACSERTSR